MMDRRSLHWHDGLLIVTVPSSLMSSSTV